MDSNISQELAEKLTDSRACVAFIFTKEGYTQAFVNGSAHDLMATLANEIVKDAGVKTIVEGALSLVKDRQKQS